MLFFVLFSLFNLGNAAFASGLGSRQDIQERGNADHIIWSRADPQTSLTLDPSVIAPAFAQGQAVNPGEVNSLTSTNNFINFCVGKTITNGQQVKGGSCNPAPMGDIPSSSNMPSAKFQFPLNGGVITANKDFTIQVAINNLQTGQFTNALAAYFAAPQQLNSQGQILGHSHVVIEQLTGLNQTTVTDPTKFTFFKGLNSAAVNGILTADVTGGLKAGFYKVSTINSASNHQPVLAPIAQHGSLDDAVYFTVGNVGANSIVVNTGGTATNSSTISSSSLATLSSISSVASSSVSSPSTLSSSVSSSSVSSSSTLSSSVPSSPVLTSLGTNSSIASSASSSASGASGGNQGNGNGRGHGGGGRGRGGRRFNGFDW